MWKSRISVSAIDDTAFRVGWCSFTEFGLGGNPMQRAQIKTFMLRLADFKSFRSVKTLHVGLLLR